MKINFLINKDMFGTLKFNLKKVDFLKKAIIIYMLLAAGNIANAQDVCNQRGLFSATTVSFGFSDLLDTYLSPLDYKGKVIGITNERIYLPRFGKEKWVAQQFVWGDFSSNKTVYGSGLTIAGSIGYSWGALYKLPKFIPDMNLCVGPYISAETGFIYNMRNGNNPVSAKGDLSLGASAMITYKLKLIRKLPFFLRYEVSTPLAGIFFSPHFEQSYYEIFSIGNNKGIIHPGVWGNRFDLKNLITIDIPFSWIGLRVGFENNIRNTHVNDIKYRRVYNTFLIGFTKDFIPFNRRKNNIENLNVINPLF